MKPLLCCFILCIVACVVLEEDISDNQIRLMGPSRCAEVPIGIVEFNWEAVPYALGYEVILMSPKFNEGRIIADTVLWADTLDRPSHKCQIELERGIYEWKVMAFNSGYMTHSEVRTLIVTTSEKLEY